jgi:hypothetical protein
MKLPDPSEESKKDKEQPFGPLKRLNAIVGAGQQDNTGGVVKPAPKKEPPKKEIAKKPAGRKKPFRLEREKVRVAYWNVSGTLSLIVNVILIAVLVLISREYFGLKRLVVGQVLDGLYVNFGKMDEAHIRTSILVEDKINVSFPLQILQNTNVTLTQDTLITNAKVTLTTGGLNIFSAPTNIVLPAGTVLPVQLNLVVDVNQDVPVSLNVDVDIPLADTELHEPFSNLKSIIEPLRDAFYTGPFYWEQAPACQNMKWLCDRWFR